MKYDAEFWASAPEGATHYHDGNHMLAAHWFKEGFFCVYGCEEGGWNGEGAWSKRAGDYIARPQQWNGTGLPPVGTVCEIETDHGRLIKIQYKVRVMYVGEEHAIVASEYGEHSFPLRNIKFLQIKTPEQIAAEEREAAIKEMAAVVKSQFSFGWVFEKLYDAGYRKTN